MNSKIFLILACLTAAFSLTNPINSEAAESIMDLSIAKGDANLGTTNESYALRIGYKRFLNAWYEGENIVLDPYIGAAGFIWKPDSHSEIFGATAFIGMALYYKTGASLKPYLSGSIGPTIISDRHLAGRNLGSEIQFESRIAVGTRFGRNQQHSLETFYAHYSNTGLWANTNPGYNIYGISYGRSF